MNIFVLDDNPWIAAQYQCDKHMVKMVLETGQILSAVHHRYGTDTTDMYKPTHARHPCVLWAGDSVENYDWTYQHFLALGEEYFYRYGRTHKTIEKLAFVVDEPPRLISAIAQTPYALAMPDEYKHDNAVDAYRAYYTGAKADLLRYTRREPPQWLH